MKYFQHYNCGIVILFALAFSGCRERVANTNSTVAPSPVQSPSITATRSTDQRTNFASFQRQRQIGNTTPPYRIDAAIENRFGENAINARVRMENLLGDWNPIGSRAVEVKEALGQPDTETSELLRYRFDTGFGGGDYNFKLEGDKVIALERTSLE